MRPSIMRRARSMTYTTQVVTKTSYREDPGTYRRNYAADLVTRGLCVRCRKNPLATKTCCRTCADAIAAERRRITAERQADGLCTNCKERPPVGKWLCRPCLDAQQAAKQSRRDTGICVRCGKAPAEIKTYCTSCSEKEGRKKDARRSRLIARGLCVNCAKQPISPRSTVHCEKCSTRGDRRKEALRQTGMCVECGKRPLSTKYRCRECADASNLAHAARAHGLTPNAYTALLNRGCDVCGSMDRLHLDHDHACCDYSQSGDSRSCPRCNRGVLCQLHNCNAGALEGPDTLALIRYLQATRSSAPLISYITELEANQRSRPSGE